jgi:hypothetical protein
MDILEHWQITQEELDAIVQANPSLRGMLFGYVSEYMLRKTWFTDARFQDVRKEDDHDRRQKGDLWFTYKSVRLSLEVQILQTNSVRGLSGVYTGKFQCDASDRRKVVLPDGVSLQTTCLLMGSLTFSPCVYLSSDISGDLLLPKIVICLILVSAVPIQKR